MAEGQKNGLSLAPALLVLGVLLQLGPILGMCTAVSGMITAVQALNSSTIGDASEFPDALGTVLVSTAVGMLVGFAGLLLIGIGLVMGVRSRWCFWSLLVISLPWLIFFPLGTLLGGGLVVFILIKRAEFFPSERAFVLPGE